MKIPEKYWSVFKNKEANKQTNKEKSQSSLFPPGTTCIQAEQSKLRNLWFMLLLQLPGVDFSTKEAEDTATGHRLKK